MRGFIHVSMNNEPSHYFTWFLGCFNWWDGFVTCTGGRCSGALGWNLNGLGVVWVGRKGQVGWNMVVEITTLVPCHTAFSFFLLKETNSYICEFDGCCEQSTGEGWLVFLHTHFLPAKNGVDFSFGGETNVKGFGMWLGIHSGHHIYFYWKGSLPWKYDIDVYNS